MNNTTKNRGYVDKKHIFFHAKDLNRGYDSKKIHFQ